ARAGPPPARPAPPPVVVGNRILQRTDALDRVVPFEGVDRAQARGGVGAAQLAGERLLALETLRDVLHRDGKADRSIGVAERADHHALLHVIEVRAPRRWTADQKAMQRRREHAAGAGIERLAEHANHKAAPEGPATT